MSAPTTTSPQSAPPPSPGEASAAQATGPRWSQRWRRWRPGVIAVTLMLVPALLTVWARTTTSTIPLAIDNPKDWGTMAVAQLLRHEGVSVSKASSLSEAVDASRQGATIAVVNADQLSDQDRRALAQAGGDVVVIGAKGGGNALAGLTDMTAKGTAASTSSTLAPQCDDADAQAARSLAGTRASVSLQGDDDAVGCFPVGKDRYAYATDSLPSGATLRVLPDPAPVANAHLAQKGHAAMGVRALGHHSRVLWLDGQRMKTPSLWNSPSTPPWLPVLILQLIVIAARRRALHRDHGGARASLPPGLGPPPGGSGPALGYRTASGRRPGPAPRGLASRRDRRRRHGLGRRSGHGGLSSLRSATLQRRRPGHPGSSA